MSAAATIIMMSAANKAKACADCVGEPLTTTQSIVLVVSAVCLIVVILWINKNNE